MTGALTGITALDFGQYVAGPLAAMLLADQGAEVIRIDPPGGPLWDVPANQVWNRGKRRITLDLKTPEDRAAARRLVAHADILIENFRPGVMGRLGVGVAEASALNPRLIYCSMPGFAGDDHRSTMPGWEGVIQAAAAVPTQPGDQPAASAIPLASVFAAFYTATSASMALLSRSRDGHGQHVEVPLFDAALGAHGFRIQRIHGSPAVPNPDVPMPGVHAWMGAHQCKDGRYVFFHPGNKRAAEFAAAVGDRTWESAPDGRERIAELFRTRTAREWEALAREYETEVALFRTTDEWLSEPHALESGQIVVRHDPTFGVMRQPGVQVALLATPGLAGEPTTDPDADRARVLDWPANPLASTAPAPAPAAPPLDGIRVLELSQLLAGPTCGRTLVEFGAEVVKIDNPRAEPVPATWAPSYLAFEVDVNRGKKSVLLDLKTPEGLEVFWTLADEADVIVQNYRPGVTDALGIGYDDVHARNPRIIYASINTYGASGPWSHLPGHEHLGQAVTGMAERFGGENTPRFQVVRAPTDHGTGITAAFAIALALRAREHSGEGQHVVCSLTATAATLQGPYMLGYAGKEAREIRGVSLGSSPRDRLYQTADGWVALACEVDRFEAVVDAVGVSAADPDRASRFEAALAGLSSAQAARLLSAVGAGVHQLATLQELVEDPNLRARGMVVSREHEALGIVDQLAPVARLSRTPTTLGFPRTPVGAAGPELLAAHGVAGRLTELAGAASLVVP